MFESIFLHFFFTSIHGNDYQNDEALFEPCRSSVSLFQMKVCPKTKGKQKRRKGDDCFKLRGSHTQPNTVKVLLCSVGVLPCSVGHYIPKYEVQ
jgi:hypothetical protein